MVRQRGHLDTELFETDEPLLQLRPRNVGQAQDLEPQRGTHAAFWHGGPGASGSPKPLLDRCPLPGETRSWRQLLDLRHRVLVQRTE